MEVAATRETGYPILELCFGNPYKLLPKTDGGRV